MGMYLWNCIPKPTTPVRCVVPDLNPQTSGSSDKGPYSCPPALLYYSYHQQHKEKQLKNFLQPNFYLEK